MRIQSATPLRQLLLLVQLSVVYIICPIARAATPPEQIVPAPQSNCTVGTVFDSQHTGCISCARYSDPTSSYAAQCSCEATNFCASSNNANINRLSFCQYNTDDSSRPRRVCALCETQCGRTTESRPTSAAVPGDPSCAETCVCRAHSECPSGFFCGKKRGFATNVCRTCSDCTNFYAIGGLCPRAKCASYFQCETNADCANSTVDMSLDDSRRWCSSNFQCHNCSVECYTSISDRAKGYANGPEDPQQDYMCTKNCCGWNTLPTHDSWHGTERFHYGLCNSEEYSNFGAFYIKEKVLQATGINLTATLLDATNNHDGIDGGDDGGAFTPPIGGLHLCNVTVDHNPPGVYPRNVPFFQCNSFLSHGSTLCEEDVIRLVVFASHRSKYVVLNDTLFRPSCSSTTREGMPPSLGGVTNVISIVVFTVIGLIVLAIVVTVLYWGSRWWVAKLSSTLNNQNHHANEDDDEMANVPPPPIHQLSSSHRHHHQTSEGEQDLSGTVNYGVDVDDDDNAAA